MSLVVEQIVKPYHQTDRFSLYEGDCRSVLPIFPDCSFDSIVTDPPAGISFMGKDWDHHKGGRDKWVAWLTDVMRECLRVLKPGGHALVWAIPRTSHWTGWAIESAGFEVRDRVSHLFGSGFPKSLDVSKAIDSGGRPEDIRRMEMGEEYEPSGRGRINYDHGNGSAMNGASTSTRNPSEAAKQWQGWGTALKPACEDWWLCRKPLEGTVAQNVLKHGTGGLNIDGCRIETENDLNGGRYRGVKQGEDGSVFGAGINKQSVEGYSQPLGRWPANVCHDGSGEVVNLFPQTSSGAMRAGTVRAAQDQPGSVCYGTYGGNATDRDTFADSGSAARFFYCPKADSADRNEGLEDLPVLSAATVTDRKDGSAGLNSPRAGAGRINGSHNPHPTVKPTDLMRYLCRLITPPGGVVLDPFCGSGSTGKAAMLEGFHFIGIELSAEYCELAQRRIEAVTKQGLLFT